MHAAALRTAVLNPDTCMRTQVGQQQAQVLFKLPLEGTGFLWGGSATS